jgi:hypothetical protein
VIALGVAFAVIFAAVFRRKVPQPDERRELFELKLWKAQHQQLGIVRLMECSDGIKIDAMTPMCREWQWVSSRDQVNAIRRAATVEWEVQP